MFGTLPVFIAVVYALYGCKLVCHLLAKFEEHLACDIFRVQGLGFDPLVDLGPELIHLVDEFAP